MVIFGFGSITNSLIEKLLQLDYEVICITENRIDTFEVARLSVYKNVRFLNRSSILMHYLITKYTIFSWRDQSALIENGGNLYNWISSSKFLSEISFHLGSASVYRNSKFALNESENNLVDHKMRNEKYLLERKIDFIMSAKSCHNINLRISNVYGSNLKSGFIGSLIQAINTGSPVSIFQNRQIIRDYLLVSDLIDALLLLLDSSVSVNTINISTGQGTSASEVLHIFEENGQSFIFEKEIDHGITFNQTSILSPQLLKTIINWNPKSLRESIPQILRR